MIRKIKNLFHLFEAVFACIYYRFPGRKLTVIGVTGTDGKTTTTNLIYHILTEAGYKTAILSTLSSAHTTTPSSLKLQKFLSQSLNNKCTHAVIEVSSHAIDQNRIWGIPFKVGVLTNIADHEHLDYHKTFENYKNTKMEFINSCQVKIMPQKPSNYESKLVGEFNKRNISSAVVTAKALGIEEEVVKKAVASFEPPSGRLEVVVKKPFLVVVDFAHTPQAFEKALPVVKKLGKRLIHVFGCTGDRDKGKRPIMGEISAKYADEIILTTEDTYSEDPQEIILQIAVKKNHLEIPDRREAIKKALEMAKSGDVVFISGVGHQKSLNIGGKEVPWSDQKTVLELIHDHKK